MYQEKSSHAKLELRIILIFIILFTMICVLGSAATNDNTNLSSKLKQINGDSLGDLQNLFDDEKIKEFYSLLKEDDPRKIPFAGFVKRSIERNRNNFSIQEALKFLGEFNDPNISSPDSHLCSDYLIKFIYLYHVNQKDLSEIYDILSLNSRHKLFGLLEFQGVFLDLANDSYFNIASKYIIDWCNNYDAWISEVKPSYVKSGNSVEVLLHTSDDRFVPLLDSILSMDSLPDGMRISIIGGICRKKIISEKLVVYVKNYYKQQENHLMVRDILIMKYLVANIGNREAYYYFSQNKVYHERKQEAANNIINHMEKNGIIYIIKPAIKNKQVLQEN